MHLLSERGCLSAADNDRRTCRRMDRVTPVPDLAHSSLDGGLDCLVCLVCDVRHGSLKVIEKGGRGIGGGGWLLAKMSEVRSTCEQVEVRLRVAV